jgi:hypothetical protein
MTAFFYKLFFVLYNGRIIWKTQKTLKAKALNGTVQLLLWIEVSEELS